MNGKCLSFHLFVRVEKKNVLSRIMEYCHSPLSSRPVFSSSSFDSCETTGSLSMKDKTCESSFQRHLITTVPPRWTFQEFSDVSAFIHEYIDNTETFDETTKTARMIQQCHSVIIIEDVNFGYSGFPDEVKTFKPERLVVAAVIVSNDSVDSNYGINSISLNEAFENPVKKILVDAMLFNESIKSSKRRVLAMIILHHLFKLCKVNEITSINASTNDETFQFFLDSGFSHNHILDI